MDKGEIIELISIDSLKGHRISLFLIIVLLEGVQISAISEIPDLDLLVISSSDQHVLLHH